MGGGIPVGSLVLLEGQSDAGRSVLSQHLAQGALNSRLSVAYYTTENTVKSLMSQMASLNLDVTDYFLCDRMRVYPLEIASLEEDATKEAFQDLIDHFDSLPTSFALEIVDSLTGLVSHSDDRAIIDFFAACKQLCDQGRTVVAVVHSYAFDDRMLYGSGPCAMPI
jgi:flagellar protein FlaH